MQTRKQKIEKRAKRISPAPPVAFVEMNGGDRKMTLMTWKNMRAQLHENLRHNDFRGAEDNLEWMEKFTR